MACDVSPVVMFWSRGKLFGKQFLMKFESGGNLPTIQLTTDHRVGARDDITSKNEQKIPSRATK